MMAAVIRQWNTTTTQGGLEQDATRGGGRGEGKLVDVRQRFHMRQHGNQSGQMRGKWEVELLAQGEVVAR
jgi:hypothetical protein